MLSAYRVRRDALTVSKVSALLLAIVCAVAFARPAPLVRAAPDWLDTINAIRASTGLAPVVVNTDPNAGPTTDDAVAHSKYLVLNNLISHNEVQGSPGYSDAGARAGQQGDVSVNFAAIDPVAAVQGFMGGGYHWEPILDPGTTAVAFGIYTDATQPGWKSASTLVFIRNNPVARTVPILWPPDGGQATNLILRPGESPDPLASCPGYAGTTGTSISVQLTAPPQITGVTITQDGAPAPVTSCWYTAATVQFKPADVGVWDTVGRAILTGANAVVIIPQQPLGNGVYHVKVMNNATTVCAWSFSVGQAPPAPDRSCGQAGGTAPAAAPQPQPAPTQPQPAPAPAQPAATVSLTGTWTIADFGAGVGGTVALTQNGTQVTGTYSYADPSGCGTENGTVTGTVNGNTLTYTTSETGCGAGGGFASTATIAADGGSFTDGFGWNGTRTSP